MAKPMRNGNIALPGGEGAVGLLFIAGKSIHGWFMAAGQPEDELCRSLDALRGLGRIGYMDTIAALERPAEHATMATRKRSIFLTRRCAGERDSTGERLDWY